MSDQTLPTTTLTGQTIASPAEYWAALRRHHPTKAAREVAMLNGADHFGVVGHFTAEFRCFKCGHYCE